jgi:hypothetical protein
LVELVETALVRGFDRFNDWEGMLISASLSEPTGAGISVECRDR